MIIDFSCTIGPWAFRRLEVSTVEGTRRALRREGIDRAVVSSLPAVLYKNPHAGNEQLVEELGGPSRFFIPFAVLNPSFPGWREDLRRSAEELGMKGLRLYPNYQRFSLRSRETQALVRAAAELGWVTCVSVRLEDERFHHWRMKVPPTPPAQVAQLACDLPEATIVLSGGSHPDLAAFFSAVGDAPNAHAELGWVKSPLEAVKTCVGQFGAERLLMGTSFPFDVPWCGTDKITRADIPNPAKQQILGGNARRLLGLS
ncbi:MAG: amidohydrolase [Armatimonadetes bacterium]|nr:amidohydrolase [Armatimonadota bacterium]